MGYEIECQGNVKGGREVPLKFKIHKRRLYVTDVTGLADLTVSSVVLNCGCLATHRF